MRKLIDPNTVQGPPELREGDISRARFVVGIILMAASFLVYPAYSMVPFLSLSDRMKIGVTVLASVLSWGVFYAGIYLSGREGYDWLKQHWNR